MDEAEEWLRRSTVLNLTNGRLSARRRVDLHRDRRQRKGTVISALTDEFQNNLRAATSPRFRELHLRDARSTRESSSEEQRPFLNVEEGPLCGEISPCSRTSQTNRVSRESVVIPPLKAPVKLGSRSRHPIGTLQS